MLSDFAEKNETFLTLKNRIFQNPDNRIFSEWYNPGFKSQKIPNSSFFRFGHNKTRNNA